jgi:hypothetical protein
MHKKFFSALPMFLFSPADDAGSGGGGASETDTKSGETPNKPANGETPKVEIPHNLTTEELREKLLTANSRIRDLNSENARIRNGAKTSDEDKAELAAFRALGQKPDDLKKELADGTAAKTKNAEAERLGELDKAAQALGRKPALLKRLTANLPVFSKEVDVKGDDGKFTKETRWFLKEGDKETDLKSSFDDETWTLMEAEQSNNGGDVTTGGQTQTTPMRRYVEQGGGDGKGKSVFEKIKERNQAQAGDKPKSLLEIASESGMTSKD